ncbi:aspartate-semialdehyde dehydrogenase [Paraburkholderia sp. WC7.3d]
MFSAGSAIARKFAPAAVRNGCTVIDNSSAFRLESDVPLVVPEVNPGALSSHQGIIANPNCVAAIATVALAPIHRVSKIRRLTISTYQAASGAGAAAMNELREATSAYLRDEAYQSRVLPHPYAFNLFSHNAEVELESGYNGEEIKIIAETRKLLDAAELPIGITCIRVPILRAHAIAITVALSDPVSPGDARAIFSRAEGLRLVDDRLNNHFPMPSEASGENEVLVGRVRRDLGDPSGHSLALFVVGDQLLKGAALNAVQIAEQLSSSIRS